MPATKTSQFRELFRTYEIHQDGNGAVLGINNINTMEVKTNSRTAGGLPDWKKRIKAGQSATTSMTGERFGIETMSPSSAFLILYDSQGKVSYVSHSYFRTENPGWNEGHLSSVTANDLALKFAHKAIQSTRTQFQGGIFLGELRETIQMLKSPLKSLHQEFKRYLEVSAKRTLRKPPKTLKKILSDTWLEFQYGWKPLINDLDEAHKAYFHLTTAETRRRIQATGRELQFEHHGIGGTTLGINISGIRETVTQKQMSVRYIIGLSEKSTGQQFNPVSERLGLTLEQFTPTVWELLPWSFLVDYFTNVGDIVSATATNQSGILWINKTIRGVNIKTTESKINETAMRDAYASQHGVWGATPGTVATRYSWMDRSSVGNVLNTPVFKVSLPGSNFQWANMAALVLGGKALEKGLQKGFTAHK